MDEVEAEGSGKAFASEDEEVVAHEVDGMAVGRSEVALEPFEGKETA